MHGEAVKLRKLRLQKGSEDYRILKHTQI